VSGSRALRCVGRQHTTERVAKEIDTSGISPGYYGGGIHGSYGVSDGFVLDGGVGGDRLGRKNGALVVT
jgi:hypothetical protein